jgi:uncharacterized protein
MSELWATAARHLDPRRHRLDAQVAASLGDASAHWGPGQAVLPLVGSAGVIACTAVLVRAEHVSTVPLDLVGFALLTGLALYGARPAIRQSGSVSAALGFGLPRWRDSGLIVGWFFLARIATTIVSLLVINAHPNLRHQNLSNVHLPPHDPVSVVVLVVFGVMIAPPIEELLFRGLALRAAMRRYSFLPSALVTSLIFGAFHAWEEHTWAGAAYLVLTTATFGFMQCLLVRRTGRLGPNIAVHSLTNAVGFLLLLTATPGLT